MRVGFVICHQSSQLFGETRELIMAQQLALKGYEVRFFRVYIGSAVINRSYFEGFVNGSFYPADNPTDIPHHHVSSRLTTELSQWSPNLVVIKGVNYKVVDDILAADFPKTRFAFILGGALEDPCLGRASLVFGESNFQVPLISAQLAHGARCDVLTKYVDWRRINALEAAHHGAPKEFDIVNVGFFESRKRQMDLVPLGAKYKIALIGHGHELEAVKSAAGDNPNIHLLGNMPNSEVLSVVMRSRIMLHPSVYEGIPRVSAEALACGVPFFGRADAISARFPENSGVFLTSAEDLFPVAERILSDENALKKASQEAKAYARATFSWSKIIKAAEDLAELVE